MRLSQRRRLARAVLAGAVLAVVAVTGAGCASGGFTGVYNLPLPGGADVGDHPYQVTAQFADVLDLVPQAAVKVNDVAVGRVQNISLPGNGWTASVTLVINGDVRLPANAVAYLRQSSLLGEKYVELAPPTDEPAQGQLGNGAVIPVGNTSRSPQVEEVFGALSLLLNGGGIAQLRTIDQQLNAAFTGNEPQIRSALASLDELVSNLDAHKQDITNAIDGLNQLSATLSSRDAQIGTVLDTLTPGLKVLDEQRGELVTMLNSLNTLSGVAVNTLNASTDDIVADLRAIQPTLHQLAIAGQSLPQALQVLATYPFTDAVLGDIKGDYLNVYLSVTAPAGTSVLAPIRPSGSSGPAASAANPGAASPTSQPPADSGTTPVLPLPPVPGTVTVLPSTGSSAPSAPGSTTSTTTPPSSSSGSGTPPPATSSTGTSGAQPSGGGS